MKKKITLLFLSTKIFAQEQVFIPTYTIVYIFTNNNVSINEVYFNHKDKQYHTNTIISTNNSDNIDSLSITNTTNLTKINILNKPTFTNKKGERQSSSSKCVYYKPKNYKKKGSSKRPSSKKYRYTTLKRTHLPNYHTKKSPQQVYPFIADHNNKVTSGLWYDHYTASYYTKTDLIQIEHVVSFAEADDANNNLWSKEDKISFLESSLMSELQPAYTKENRIKGSYFDYCPPNPLFQPIFSDMRKHTLKYYQLQ